MMTNGYNVGVFPETARHVWIGLVVFAAASTTGAFVNQDAELRPAVRTYASELAQAAGPVDAETASEALFAYATDKEVASLKKHSNDGVAMRAAWEVFRRTLPKDETENDEHGDKSNLCAARREPVPQIGLIPFFVPGSVSERDAVDPVRAP